jgi:hypothetical protein
MSLYNPDYDAANTLDESTMLKLCNDNYNSYGLGNLYNAMYLWGDYHETSTKGDYWEVVYTNLGIDSDTLQYFMKGVIW